MVPIPSPMLWLFSLLWYVILAGRCSAGWLWLSSSCVTAVTRAFERIGRKSIRNTGGRNQTRTASRCSPRKRMQPWVSLFPSISSQRSIDQRSFILVRNYYYYVVISSMHFSFLPFFDSCIEFSKTRNILHRIKSILPRFITVLNIYFPISSIHSSFLPSFRFVHRIFEETKKSNYSLIRRERVEKYPKSILPRFIIVLNINFSIFLRSKNTFLPRTVRLTQVFLLNFRD